MFAAVGEGWRRNDRLILAGQLAALLLGFASAAAMAQDHPQQMLIFLNQLLGTKRETQGNGRRCGQDDLGLAKIGLDGTDG